VNAARIAKLFRDLARIHGELADEFDARPLETNTSSKRSRTRAVLPVMPATMPSEVDMARARQQLQRLGYRTGVKR
jgi:hypothetical protein